MPHPEQLHLQGDLFQDFPFPVITEAGELELHERTVLVLNNTCDLEPDRMDFVSVVPVLHVDEEVEAAYGKSFLTTAKANKVSDLFYIGPFAGNPKGVFAYLGQPVHVPVNLFRDQLKKGSRIASLTQKGAYVFQMKFMYHVARAETDEVIRL